MFFRAPGGMRYFLNFIKCRKSLILRRKDFLKTMGILLEPFVYSYKLKGRTVFTSQ